MTGNSDPRTMPTPPARGIGALCTFRLAGRSIIPKRGARRTMIGIMTMLMAMAVMKEKR
jgi:hypothetical protein